MRKIYDDIFRTLTEKHSKLLIPLINEFFSKTYSINEPIELLSGEHHLLPNALDKETKEVITDSSIKIKDNLYHIECQSNPDGTMVLRMVEYDFCIALRYASEDEDGCYVMKFPTSAVLYLRHNKNTPDAQRIKIQFPNGNEAEYEVPIIKVQEYSYTDIISKNFYFFIPYYILRYENISDGDNFDDIISEYKELYKNMHKAYEDGTLNEYDISNIQSFTDDLIEYISRKNEKIKEGAENIMGGEVIETYADIRVKKALKEQAEEHEKEKTEEKLGFARYLISKGTNLNEISVVTDLPVEEIKKLIK